LEGGFGGFIFEGRPAVRSEAWHGGDMYDAFAMLPALTGRQSAALQESLAWANDWKNYPADTPTNALRTPKPRR
jgi:hypothetical protein